MEFYEAGKLKRVYFKDGSNLGHGQNSDLIYATIKYASVVRGGVKPNPESFYSGWVTARGGGVIGIEGKLALVITLSNKAPVPIWVNIVFSTPTPSDDCDETVLLRAGEDKGFRCTQDRLHTDELYSILVDVYLEQSHQNIVDRNILTQRWDQAQAAVFQKAVAETMK